jgi:two-component system, sensor histidine kinase and response regulator
MMPEMDGFEFAGEIQHDPRLSGSTIMMLSSAGQASDAARCRDLGVASYLTKPIKQSDLLDSILTLLANRTGVKAALMESIDRSTSSSVPIRKLRVLVAEDNLVNQRLAIRLLEKHGHAAVIASDGREALAALDREQFDLVLMDVQMPNVDGFEAMAIIRENEVGTGEHMPIVAMTAHAMKGDRERCVEAGFDDYVSKPIHVEELFKVINRMVMHDEAPPMDEAPAMDISSGVICDRAAALANLDNDTELLREIARLFVEDCPRLMAEVRDAVAANDGLRLDRAAHALKGSVAYFSAPAAFEAVIAMETISRSGTMNDAPHSLLRLESVIEKVVEELTDVAAVTV